MLSTAAHADTLDSLYRVLDAEVANASHYVALRQQRTDALKAELGRATQTAIRYELCMRLFDGYKAVRSDSAFYYIDAAASYARDMGDCNKEALSLSQKAFLCSTLGLYMEAVDVFGGIDASRLDEETQGWYALAGQHVYGELAYYSPIDSLRAIYQEKANSYERVLLEKLPEENEERLLRLEMKYYNEGKVDEALEVNDRRMSQVRSEDRQMAIISFYRFLDLRLKGDNRQALEWLVRAAIIDARNGIMDQGAMWEVANLLNAKGNIERGYRYITYAMECAQAFGTRMRSWQISPVLKTVNSNYTREIKEANNRLTVSIILISILSVLFFIAAIYVNRHRRLLAEAKSQLDKRNSELAEVNSQLTATNTRLNELNGQLHETLLQLADSSRAKEMYIGRFFTLCSAYVDRLDKLRMAVNRSAKRRDINGLVKLTGDSEQKEKDLAELYQNFDSTFLKLYPTFVEQFNAMLKPEHRIEIQEGKLTITLRIFALIRLGIEDSGKIAEFLHYSVNTIYNYRARVKNAAIDSREHFEDRVKEIK